MDFREALAKLGFRLGEKRAFGGGARLHEAHPNAFMTYTVQAFDDGTAIFSWEFALGKYLAGRGLQVGSGEALNPKSQDVKGDPTAGALLDVLRFDER